MQKNTERFSDRVADYVKYRPSYPQALMSFFRNDLKIPEGSKIADIGSGTGIFSKLLLKEHYEVYGVEPNSQMKAAAESLLAEYSQFHSIWAPAEHTTLPNRSIDAITAAQAFHWFDPSSFKREALRILKPGAFTILIWNDREEEASPFLFAYEEFLNKYGTDYAEVKHRNTDESGVLKKFFEPSGYELFTCPNHQTFDFEGLKGRLLSSSYAPQRGHPRHDEMIEALHLLFEQHQTNRKVVFSYKTKAYYGKFL
jgi:SAM-dependent methyltransferase